MHIAYMESEEALYMQKKYFCLLRGRWCTATPYGLLFLKNLKEIDLHFLTIDFKQEIICIYVTVFSVSNS